MAKTPQISITAPTPEERALLLRAQKMVFSKASLGAWILECALRHCDAMVNSGDTDVKGVLKQIHSNVAKESDNQPKER